MLLFLGLALASSILKELQPKELVTFFEMINPAEDQYGNFSLGLVSQSSAVFYRIIPPSTNKKHAIDKDNSDTDLSESKPDLEEFEKPLERSFSTKLETPGLWTIQLYNRGDSVQRITISSHVVKKMNKGNEDVTELRNLLNSIQTAVEELANENYYANNIQKANIKDAERIKSTLNWLIFVPFMAFGISWFKYVCARQIVRPKGKRFKGLF